MYRKSLRRLTALTMLFALCLASGLQTVAQEVERSWIQVRTVHVKPDLVGDFVELQKALVAAMKAADRPGRATWREVRGDLATFHFVQPITDLAEFDKPFVPPMDDDDWEDWVAAILNTTDSSTLTILRRHQEWSIAPKEGAMPNLALLRTTTVMPDKMADYHVWLSEKLLPALIKGGASGINFNHVVFGANANTWVTGSMMDNWAQLQRRRGSLSYMSDADYAKLMAPRADMVTATDMRILQFEPDLSF